MRARTVGCAAVRGRCAGGCVCVFMCRCGPWRAARAARAARAQVQILPNGTLVAAADSNRMPSALAALALA